MQTTATCVADATLRPASQTGPTSVVCTISDTSQGRVLVASVVIPAASLGRRFKLAPARSKARTGSVAWYAHSELKP